MRQLLQSLKNGLAQDSKGATAVEYGLLISLMVLALIAALGSTGDRTEEKWNEVATDIVEAAGTSE